MKEVNYLVLSISSQIYVVLCISFIYIFTQQPESQNIKYLSDNAHSSLDFLFS